MNPMRPHMVIITALFGVACTARSTEDSSTSSHLDESHLVFGQGAAGLWSEPDGTQVLQIDVRNDSETPTGGAVGSVEIVGKRFTAELIPSPTASEPRALGPHEQGVLQVRFWGDPIARCSDVTVTVDYDPTLDDQHQSPGRHRATVHTQCLRWDTLVDTRTVPALRDPSLDRAAVAAAVGKTLHDVVSSRVSGRADTKLCSDCHHRTSAAKYNPDVEQGLARDIVPSLPIAATEDANCATSPDPACLPTWSRANRGWAVRFNNTTNVPGGGTAGPKPAALRVVFAQWLDDGGE